MPRETQTLFLYWNSSISHNLEECHSNQPHGYFKVTVFYPNEIYKVKFLLKSTIKKKGLLWQCSVFYCKLTLLRKFQQSRRLKVGSDGSWSEWVQPVQAHVRWVYCKLWRSHGHTAYRAEHLKLYISPKSTSNISRRAARFPKVTGHYLGAKTV